MDSGGEYQDYLASQTSGHFKGAALRSRDKNLSSLLEDVLKERRNFSPKNNIKFDKNSI